METQNKTDQSQINRVVWKACDTFRGVIDPSQYKDYILTMLFLKVGSINSIFYFLHKAAEPFNCLEQDNLA